MKKGPKDRKTKLDQSYGIAKKYQISHEQWQVMHPCLPPAKIKLKAGRPRMEDRKAMTAILYVLRTGIQWEALPHSLGAKSTVHDRFQEWVEARVFLKLWQQGLISLAVMEKLDLQWQAADGSMVKAPLGGEKKRSQSNRPRQVGMQTQSAH